MKVIQQTISSYYWANGKDYSYNSEVKVYIFNSDLFKVYPFFFKP